MDKKKYIVAAVLLIAVVLGGLAYSGFDFSKLTGAITSVRKVPNRAPAPIVSLTASSTSNPESDILLAGSLERLVSRYSFKSSNENFVINKLTVINDLTGTFDSAVNTSAVALVLLKYPDINGVMLTKSGILTNGVATFPNLGFYVPKGSSGANIDIYADISPMNVGGSFSGSNFRLGIKDTQNIAATFEAVGTSTAIPINSFIIFSSPSVKPFTVRKSKPSLGMEFVQNTTLPNGEATFYKLMVTALNGDVGLAHLVYDVTTTGLSGGSKDIYNWQFYRGSTLIPSDNVNIYCTDSGGRNNVKLQSSVVGSGLELCDGMSGDGIKDGTYKIIVTFNTEETVIKNSTQTYHLKGAVSGVTTGSKVVTRVATGDDNVALTGLTASLNSNTGKIYADSDPTSGIFTSGPADFSLYPASARNIIWSDMSANVHSYPNINVNIESLAMMVSGSGSADWTNGYLLKAAALPAVTLSY